MQRRGFYLSEGNIGRRITPNFQTLARQEKKREQKEKHTQGDFAKRARGRLIPGVGAEGNEYLDSTRGIVA